MSIIGLPSELVCVLNSVENVLVNDPLHGVYTSEPLDGAST